MNAVAPAAFVDAGDLRLAYRSLGEGPPVVLLHGWPTSSFLWRDVMPPIAAANRVIALDLPGFGASDKPTDASYSFRYFAQVLDDAFDALGLDDVALAVHDLGGPAGIYWACTRTSRLRRLALLNTLVYPELSWAVIAFGLGLKLPLVRSAMVSPRGIDLALRLGVHDRSRLTRDVLDAYRRPFGDASARRALVKSGQGLSPKGFRQIAETLPTLDRPIRIVYGTRDRILPDVAKTMARVAADCPGTEVTALDDCGHFLQEEQPEVIGRLLADFFAADTKAAT